MHPIFNSSRSLFSVFIFWLFISFLVAILVADVLQPHFSGAELVNSLAMIVPWYFVYIFVCFSNIYVCIWLPLDSGRFFYVIGIQLILLCFSVGIWLLLGYWWSNELSHFYLLNTNNIFSQSLTLNILLGAILYATWILIHYSYLSALHNETESSEQLEQKLLIRDIELKAVKATVHPHFMYNSLNMLANMSLVSPEKIHGLCVKMSEFLRYSVNYSSRDTVTIEDELTHIENYLAVERERFGERLVVTLNTQKECQSVVALPLLLFPLVENAIKHGIGSQIEQGFITLDIKKNESMLIIDMRNSFDSQGQKVQSTGLGLYTLRKRIRGFYGETARVNIDKGKKVFTVRLELPVRDDV